METQTKINSGVAVLLLLIAGFAIVGDTTVEPTHYCEEREIKAYCYSLSSTMKTCYTEMNKTGGKRCVRWKEVGSLESVIINDVTYPTLKPKRWLCPPRTDAENCTLIEKL